MAKENRDFKGVWIDKVIWLNKELTWMEKLFITEINSLDNKDGCFASNSYFADFFQLSTGRCSQIINELIKKKYIKARYEYKGKEIVKRVLNILNTPIKNTKGGIKELPIGYLGNAKDSNTVSNTLSIYIPILDHWNSKENLMTHQEKSFKSKFQKKHRDQVNIFGVDEVIKAIDNYYLIVSEVKYYWSHKYTLWNFIFRGLDNFVDTANPKENYISKDYIEQKPMGRVTRHDKK